MDRRSTLLVKQLPGAPSAARRASDEITVSGGSDLAELVSYTTG
jgi:hypothetical protein